MLAEEIFVFWAQDNLLVPKFMRIAFITEEQRDPVKPIRYVVGPSEEFIQLIGKPEAQRG